MEKEMGEKEKRRVKEHIKRLNNAVSPYVGRHPELVEEINKDIKDILNMLGK